MNFGNLLTIAAILSQTGGTSFQKTSNHTETPDACFVPSCTQEDWAKATLEIGNKEGGSLEWCTRIPQDETSSTLIQRNMKKAFNSAQDQAASTGEQLTEAGVVTVLEAVMENYCEFTDACRGEKSCTFETLEILSKNRYGKPLKETKKKEPKNLHVSRGRGGR